MGEPSPMPPPSFPSLSQGRDRADTRQHNLLTSTSLHVAIDSANSSAATGADALLVTNFKNVTYLTGFTGDDSYLLVTLDGETLITDPRYTTQLEQECPGLALGFAPGVKMLTAVTKVVERESRAARHRRQLGRGRVV